MPAMHAHYRSVGWDLGKLMIRDFTSLSWKWWDEGKYLQKRWGFSSFIWSNLSLYLAYGCVQIPRRKWIQNTEFWFFPPITYFFLSTKWCRGCGHRILKSMSCWQRVLHQIMAVFTSNHKTDLSELKKKKPTLSISHSWVNVNPNIKKNLIDTMS